MGTRVMVLVGTLLATLAGAADNGVVGRYDFAGTDALAAFQPSGAGTVSVEDGALRVGQTDTGMTVATLALPIERVKGQRVSWQARLKAQDVSTPKDAWNGIKFMLVIQTPRGTNYPAPRIEPGTWDWQTTFHSARVPDDATSAQLNLGLQDSSGTVWFDDLQIVLGRPPALVPEGFVRPETMFKGHDLPRGRGFMVGPRFRQSDWADLATKFKVNLIRWQINWAPMKEAETWAADIAAYDQWLAGALAECDQALDAAEKLNILVLVDLHCPPGGRRQGGHCRLFDEQKYQDQFLRIWDQIARRYQGREVVWAYDLVNEPVQTHLAAGLDNWHELATKAVDVIRKVDPDKPVLVEPTPWGSCDGFETLPPIARPRIIYGFHMYTPHQFTHQSIHNLPFGLVYPGEIGKEYWDKDRLRQAMQPAIDFQREFNVHIHVGEFSAIRWAPDNSADRYIRDLVDLFEEQGWDWTYHAYREYEGWSCELDTTRENTKPPAEPSVRERILRGWFDQDVRSDLH